MAIVDYGKLLFEDPFFVFQRAQGVLAIVGACYAGRLVAQLIWDVVNGIRIHFWSRVWKRNLVETYGKWAVVTGSTDGIGKGYAKELARQGMNIMLVSRSVEKLERVSEEIRTQFGVETDIVQADFSHGRAVYGNIAKHLEGKDVGILVNNVGMLLPPRLFEDLTEDDIWNYAAVNVASVPSMTRLVFPRMLKRRRGAIVNISSSLGRFPLPYMQVYTATKAFVSNFTQSLQYEYPSSGVTIQCIEPAAVSTNMTKFEDLLHNPGLLVATYDGFARNAVATLGYSNNTSGYWSHGMQLKSWLCIPEWFFVFVSKKILERSHRKLE